MIVRYEPSKNVDNMGMGEGSSGVQQNGIGTGNLSYGSTTKYTEFTNDSYHNAQLRGSQEQLVGGPEGDLNQMEDDSRILPRPLAMCYDAIAASIEPKWMVARVFLGLPDSTVAPTEESSQKVAKLVLLISVDFLFLHIVTVFSPSWTWYFACLALLFLAGGYVTKCKMNFQAYNSNMQPMGPS